MTQATGSSFFTQAMAVATANTSSTALPELLAFVGSRLGQARAQALVQKVGHLLTVEQQYTLKETYLYGSSRLGVKNQSITLSSRVASVQNGSLTPVGNAMLNTDSVFSGTATALGLPKIPSSRVFHRSWGLKQYELSNHLGNVQVTVSDKKLGVVGNNGTDFTAYQAEVKSATDYYAYGMEMPGKAYQSTAYRYGMNTQEKDNEIYGPGNVFSALFWEYDARIARRWNVDPRPNVSISSYASLGNNPVWFSDDLGDTVKTTQEGFNIINEGLTATLGENHGFGYSAEKGIMTYSAPEGMNYSNDQKNIIDRFISLINSKTNTIVNIVQFDEKIDLTGKSLKDYGFNAITLTPKDFSRFNVFIARDPMKKALVYNPQFHPFRQDGEPEKIPGFINASLFERGVASIHELGGHVYFRLTKPTLSPHDHNSIVEMFETNFRQFYQIGTYDSEREVRRAKRLGLNVKVGDAQYLGGEADRH